MDLIRSLTGNISQNLVFLQQDYLGVSFNFSVLFSLITNVLLPSVLIIIFYLIGSKIKLFFFKKDEGIIDVFVGIAFGYIFIASGILVLGMLGVLYRSLIYIYIILVSIVAVYPLSSLKRRLISLEIIYKEYLRQFKKNKLINIAILGFVLIGFLRLVPPETGVDAIWYHTDYPNIYLKTHSMMTIDPRGKYYPAVTPTLSDMMFVVAQSVLIKDASRYIHFSFYILSILVYLVIFGKKYPFAPWAALLFVTSPVIIRVAPSAYAEFPWILCWLLAVFLVTSKRKHTIKDIILPAVLIGGALATKLWMLPFYGVFVLYILVINIKEDRIRLLRLLLMFTVISFLIPFLWYLRAYMITGNPLFPTFWSYPNGEPNSPVHIELGLASIKTRILSMANVSPLSAIGFVFLLFTFLKTGNLRINKLFVIFAAILTITHILINYNYHRFVIPFYSIIAVILAYGIMRFIKINKYFNYSFYLLVTGLFLYYFINTLFTLPYGLGITNENRYLSRILSRDNSSYYDYNNQFSKLITEKNTVATYGLWGFYYANFKYLYTEDIFRKGERSLSALEKRGADKILLLGGDINWLCRTEKLTDCAPFRYKLLTSYKFTTSASAQYLYKLNKYAK